MSILIDRNTRVIVQGITGREGEFHARAMREYGTQVVGGTRPGKGGTLALGDVPVFDTVRQAVEATGANASCIFVPGPGAADAILEAVDAGLALVACISDPVPEADMVRAVAAVKRSDSRLIGANCPGLISPPERCKIGIMPGSVHAPGPVGLISRSGTLTYEIVAELTRAGLGQTSCVGIGGDKVLGTSFIDVLPLFEADPDTKVVVLVGEIGGDDEEIASEFVRMMATPVVGFVSGRTAPPGKRMGHAGAIVSGSSGTAQAKVDALEAAGARVADTTHDIPALVRKALEQA